MSTCAARDASDAGTAAGLRASWTIGHPHQVPAGDAWLTPAERRAQQRYLVPSRRAQWRLGRATAERALRAWLADAGTPVVGTRPIGVVARGADDGFPIVEGLGEEPPALSISHRGALALVGVGAPGSAIGVDLERVEARPRGFAGDWFAPSSLERLHDAEPARRDQLVTLTWSVTEAALKALGVGLRVDTRCVEVRTTDPVPGGCGWGRADAVVDGTDELRGWWRPLLGHVVVVVGDADALARPPRRNWAPA